MVTKWVTLSELLGIVVPELSGQQIIKIKPHLIERLKYHGLTVEADQSLIGDYPYFVQKYPITETVTNLVRETVVANL